VNVQERIELGQKDRPVDELLAAYAAGSLNAPLMALMAAHLELKPARRAYVAALEAAYGILLEEIEPVPLTNRDRRLVEIFASDDAQDQPVLSLGRTLSGNRQNAQGSNGQAYKGQAYNGQTYNAQSYGGRDRKPLQARADRGLNDIAVLPPSLRRFIGRDLEEFEWRTAASGIKQSVIATGSFGEEILMRFLAGKRTPAHGHHGLEVMLVLKGGFSDGYGQYRRGDVCVADETVEHQPIADPDEDCVVYVVRAAPVKIVRTMDRVIQLFLGR
jgi:putative transcriptional regulator